jgi:hypothetical protein
VRVKLKLRESFLSVEADFRRKNMPQCKLDWLTDVNCYSPEARPWCVQGMYPVGDAARARANYCARIGVKNSRVNISALNNSTQIALACLCRLL